MSAARLGVPVLAAVALLIGCDFERSAITRPLGDPAFNFGLTVDGRGLPGGRVERVEPRSAADFPAVDSTYEIVLTGLEPLASGVYQAWLGTVDPDDPVEPTWVAATGNLTVTRIDTTFTAEGDPVPDTTVVVTASGVSSFTEGGPATQVRLTVSRSSLGSASPFEFNTVLVSLEGASGAAQPAQDRRPIWSIATGGTSSTRRFVVGTDTSFATVATTPNRFGNFDPDPSLRYVFVSTGRGTAGIRGNILIVDDSALARPPEGYFYATWVVQHDADGNPTDTLQLGPQTAPFPDRSVSLRDADIELVHPVVLASPPSILAASSRIELSAGANPFFGFGDLWVTLENKLGIEDAAAPTIVLSGTVPTIVSEGP